MTIEYKNKKGQLHREGDLPAVELNNGYKAWWINGRRHRDFGKPAVEWNDSIIHSSWWVNGKKHRADDLPAVEYTDGSKEWFVNGNRHRDCGLPAVEDSSGYREWWINGERHRELGLPAIERISGENEWYLHGRHLSPEEATAYSNFCHKMTVKKRIKSQKKIYFWWIQICYDLSHPSGCGKRMAQLNLAAYEGIIKRHNNL